MNPISTQLSRYGPQMFSNSRANMNNFLYEVSDLEKLECKNAMLLENMKIPRLMAHASKDCSDKLREKLGC